ncbi:MAG TPA: serine hydrolase domain-containing protein [Kofleriaceae bacterium]|nr:serine hydrolase domain-containing protein [Kofleriaceae bacterium]
MLLRVAIVLALVACKPKSEPAKAPPLAHAGDAGTADAAKSRTLDEELEAIRSETKLPALAAAVWRNGKLVEIGAVGLRKVDDPTSKVTTKDYWHLGSNTKAMTATLIGIYVDRGALHWDDTLGKLFGKVDPGYAKVTLDQILRHEGGAPGEPPDALWKQLWADGDKPDARAKFVAGILAKPPAHTPGIFVYSNAGYMIAGAALEKVTKKPWQQLMRDELFAKLGMTSCGFGAPGRKDVVDEPWGHDAGGTPIAPGPAADNPPGLGPAGTVHCSLEDYGKFLAMHSTGEPALVTPETMQHLHAARDASTGRGYAGGWLEITTTRGTVLAHSGSNTMWYVTAMVALASKPDDKWIFVMATNSGTGNAIENNFERLVRRHIVPK